MSLIQKALGYLIQPIAKEDFRLFQILTGLNDQEVKLVDQGNLNESIDINFEYRFELPGVLPSAMDIYPVWKQVKLPLDNSNNVISNGQKITKIDINAKVAGAADSSINILITKDRGVTFNSILGPDPTQKLIIPATLLWISYGGTYFTGGNVLQDGWWFRIDALGDGTLESVELVIRGVLVF